MIAPMLLLAALAAQPAPATAAAPTATDAKSWPTKEGDVVLGSFRFHDGETLPELRMHYTSWGSRIAIRPGKSTTR